MSGTSYALESLETSFGEDLNGDGTIGPATTLIASNGVTKLVQVANQYALENSSGSILAWLSYQGNAVTAGELGATDTPAGARQTGNGYEVVWSLGANEFAVWNTDANGNYTSNATGAVAGYQPDAGGDGSQLRRGLLGRRADRLDDDDDRDQWHDDPGASRQLVRAEPRERGDGTAAGIPGQFCHHR